MVAGFRLGGWRLDRQMRFAWARLPPGLPRRRPTAHVPASRREAEPLARCQRHGEPPRLCLATWARHQPDERAGHATGQRAPLAPGHGEFATLGLQRIEAVPRQGRHRSRVLPLHAAGAAGALVVTTGQPDGGRHRFARLPSHRRVDAIARAVVPAVLQASLMALRALPRHLAAAFQLAAHQVVVGRQDVHLGRAQPDPDRGVGRLWDRLPRVAEIEVNTCAARWLPRPPEFEIDRHCATRSVLPVPH